jgi:plasmid stabilization system protein ParE
MAFKIVWTDHATEDFLNIVNYLEQEWSARISENFIVDCYAKLDLLEATPLIGISSTLYKNVRRIMITKNIALYYEVRLQNVTLLNFFDVRQSPIKNLFD